MCRKMTISLTQPRILLSFSLNCLHWMGRNVLRERLMNKDDKNRHFVLLIIDISKHGAKEMGHVKMAGPGFVNDVTAWWPGFVPNFFYEQTGTKATEIHNHHCFRYDNVTLSPLLLPARVTNRSHSKYGSSARSDSHRAVFCPNSVVSGWKN